MSSRFEDERGVIQDMLTEPVDAVTRIFTVAGAVRGNHVHHKTTQWTYVTWGRMLVVTRSTNGTLLERTFGPGDMFCELPGVAHAWKALDDTQVLVFTRGPRSGENYESDVVRLAPGERLIQ